MFSGAPAVEVVLELHKYYFWRNVLMHDIWRLIHLQFIFLNYHGEEQTMFVTSLDIKTRDDIYRNMKRSSMMPLLLAHEWQRADLSVQL